MRSLYQICGRVNTVDRYIRISIVPIHIVPQSNPAPDALMEGAGPQIGNHEAD
jgi:hypothetical protein